MSTSYEIIKFRAKNFAHFSSIGLDDFTIDRTGSDNDIILLLSSNGMGKSLLAASWTPLPHTSTNNRKKTLIVEGLEGLKELSMIRKIDGIIDGYTYKCRIIYGSSTNCSIIRLNNNTGDCEELNPSGLVSSYELVLESLFNINKKYATIGFISPQLTSLIEMSPGPRYDSISAWSPDVTDYLDIYKKTFKKSNQLSRQISILEKEIGDLSLSETIKNRSMLQERLSSMDKELVEVREAVSSLETVGSQLIKVDQSELSRLKSIMNTDHIKLTKEREKLIDISSKSSKYIGDNGRLKLTMDINGVENRLSNLRGEINSLTIDINDKKIALQDLSSKYDTMNKIGETLPEIRGIIERVELHIYNTKNMMDSYHKSISWLSEIDPNLNDSTMCILNNLLFYVRDRCNKITECISIEKIGNLYDYSSSVDERIKLANSTMSDIDDRINKTLGRISILRGSPLDDKILTLAPKQCSTKVCPLMMEVERLTSPDSEIDKLNNELKVLYNRKTELHVEIENIVESKNNVLLSMTYMEDITHSLNRDKEYISLLPSNISTLLASDKVRLFNSINSIMGDFETLIEYITVKDQYLTYIKELESLRDRESTLKVVSGISSSYDSMSKTIVELTLTRSNKADEVTSLLSNLSYLRDLSVNIESINEQIANYNASVKQYSLNLTNFRNLCGHWKNRGQIMQAVEGYNIKLTSLSTRRMEIEREIDKLNSTISTKTSLTSIRDEVISCRSKLEVILAATHPKTGIPGSFINNFLNRIHMSANNYLKALDGNALQIIKFEIGESSREFPIVIRKEDGTIVPDASECSEGQIAMIEVAISMAMISEAIKDGEYNIIRIDESDAFLDTHHRKTYIDLIRERLAEVGCTQCVLISHSPEVLSTKADVILLPGAELPEEYRYNKNILLDHSSIE